MAKVTIYDMTGKSVGERELNDAIFAVTPNKAVLHEVVKNYLANQRQGTQSTLTRTEVSGAGADIKPGNALPLANIPVGTFIHNVELYPGKGAQLARAAGNMAQLMAKEGKYGMVRLPSGELRNVQLNCMATIGQVGNIDHENVNIGKAGRTRHMGIRPTVRGSVMNPCDHPHGGGEGRAPIGRPGPVTPWGKPALGYKTRDKHKASDKFIVKRRNTK